MARPAPERWGALAEWLDVSVPTLLRAEGLSLELGHDSLGAAADGPLDSARTLIEAAVEQEVVTTAEASTVIEVLERVRAASTGSHTRRGRA